MLIGAHVSVAGGYLKALDYAQSVGAECFQMFAKSPRQWRGPAVDPDLAAAFVEARRAAGFGPVFTHTAYLINLSTKNEELLDKSVEALADELVRGALVGASGVVTHIGNDPDRDGAAAATRVGSSIRRAFELAGDAGERVRLLLENTAGAGSSYGCTFEEIAESVAAAGLPSDRLGMCLDTCHAFAHGFDISTREGWAEVISAIDDGMGLDRLGLIHANDCMFELGTHRDRHAWVGDGFIGEQGFSTMVCAPELAHVPAVTEMPGEVPVKDVTNVGRLLALRDACQSSH